MLLGSEQPKRAMALRNLLSTLLPSILLLYATSCDNTPGHGANANRTGQLSPVDDKKLVVMLHGLGSSPEDLKPLKNLLKPLGVRVVIPREKNTFNTSIEDQAENLYRDSKFQEKVKSATSVFFICVSQGGPRAVALLRKYGAEAALDLQTKAKAIISIGSPWEGTPVVAGSKRDELKDTIIPALEKEAQKLASLLEQLKVITQGGPGVTDMAPISDCTKDNIAYLEKSKIPMLAIAGQQGGNIDDITDALGVSELKINGQDLKICLNGLYGGPDHDLSVPVKSARADNIKISDITRCTVPDTIHGSFPNMSAEVSLFENKATKREIVNFLTKHLNADATE